MPARTARFTALVVVVGLLAVACSSGDKATPARSSSTSRPTTTSANPAAAAASRPPVRSAGCGRGDPRPVVKDERRTLAVKGQERWYLLTTPAGDAGTPLPLVLDFHGLLEGAQVHTRMSKFGDLAQRERFVVATPNGMGQPIGWKLAPDVTTNPDLGFLHDLLDKLESDLCIDTSRVYATGLSMGAMMSSVLACTMDDRFAAVAPVAGVIMPTPCTARRAVPMLVFHGTKDPFLAFNGGIGNALGRVLGAKPSSTPTTDPAVDLHGKGFPATVAAWAERSRCDPRSVRDTDVSDEIVQRTFRCPGGAEVVFDIIIGGGHSWPGSEFSRSIGSVVGPTTFDINGTDEIWRFFQRHQLPDNVR